MCNMTCRADGHAQKLIRARVDIGYYVPRHRVCVYDGVTCETVRHRGSNLGSVGMFILFSVVVVFNLIFLFFELLY